MTVLVELAPELDELAQREDELAERRANNLTFAEVIALVKQTRQWKKGGGAQFTHHSAEYTVELWGSESAKAAMLNVRSGDFNLAQYADKRPGGPVDQIATRVATAFRVADEQNLVASRAKSEDEREAHSRAAREAADNLRTKYKL